MTPEVIQKLEYAYSIGCSDMEATLYAGISKTALHNYLEKNPDFKARRELLRETPILKARQGVYNALKKEDPVMIRWYLEKKKNDEFSARHEIDINQTGSLSIESRSQALNAFLSRFNPDQVGE